MIRPPTRRALGIVSLFVLIGLLTAIATASAAPTSSSRFAFIDGVSEFFLVAESSVLTRPDDGGAIQRDKLNGPNAVSGTIFTETVGTTCSTTLITSYTGWSNPSLTFTGSGDTRSTSASSGYGGASGSCNVFLTNTAGKNFEISGINTSTLSSSSLKLSFGVFKSTSAATGADLTVEVSSDGVNYTPLTFAALPSGAAWFERTASGTIPSAANLHIRFTNTAATEAAMYRLDDITLTGLAGSPSPLSGAINVGAGQTYTSLTNPNGLFEAIDENGLGGNVTVSITSDLTSETGTWSLNEFASPFTLTIQPSGNRVVSGAVSAGATLIDLNGADRVTINGLDNGSNSLTISNTTASSTTGTSTIRFINDATNNTVQHCTILGSGNTATSGVIFFSTGTSTGNDGNTINANNIGPAGSTLPLNGIYSAGSTSPADTSGVQITNNNIFDFFAPAATDAGMLVSAGNTDWTITGNSIYQTATRTATAAANHFGIQINNSSGNNFVISNNSIGGSAASAGGASAWTIAGSFANVFKGINLSVGSTTSSSIQGNTVTNLNITSTSNNSTTGAAFAGIYLHAGNANIGTTTANTIGSGTGTGSITISGATNSGGISDGILCDSPSTASAISNNVIGSISFSTSAVSLGFNGIATTGTATTLTISDNHIGSQATANSINDNTGSTATGGGQPVRGVFNTTSATISITNNTILNINNNFQPTGAVSVGRSVLAGIVSENGVSTITGNTIGNMTTPAGFLNTGNVLPIVVGISVSGSTGSGGPSSGTVSQNKIFSLSDTNASTTFKVDGIYNTSGITLFERNLTYSLSSSSPSNSVNGMEIAGGASTYQNNMIDLGSGLANDMAINGILESGGTNNFYFNSVYIGGTGVSGSDSTSALNTNSAGARTYKDNIFQNARSNGAGTGKHYGVQVAGGGTFTSDYNLIFANGTGGVFGSFNGSDQADLAAWKSATGQDAHSLSADPLFKSPTTATPDLHLQTTSPAIDSGTDVGVTNDYDGDTRPNRAGVDIGADEVFYSPSTAKSFGAASIEVGQTSSMTITITNINTTASLTGVGFTDTMPAGLSVPDAAPAAVCNGGTLTIASNVITLTGATVLANNGTCVVGVTVTGTSAQNPATNTTSAVTSSNGGTGGTASASITVTAPTPPMVSSTSPADGANAVAPNTSISVTFDSAMMTSTITTQTSAGACSGSIQVSSNGFSSCIAFGSANPTATGGDTVFTSTPASNLAGSTTYKIRVTTAAKNSSGTPLASQFTQMSGFTTAFAAPTTFVVNNTGDAGDAMPGDSICETVTGNATCTLRAAIQEVNALPDVGRTITFSIPSGDSGCAGGVCTITLGSQLPAINATITIDGSGQTITVSGGGSVRVMYVNIGKTLTLLNLTIANGSTLTDAGGGIYNNRGTLNVTNSTFSGNRAPEPMFGVGGGIFNFGTATVTGSTFSGNSAGPGGGGIYSNGTLTVINSTFTGNNVGGGGGGIQTNGGTVINSTFSGNNAGFGGGIYNTATITLRNTLLVKGAFGGNCLNSGTLTAGPENMADDASCDAATPKTSAEINLQALANNGGPTQTMALGAGSAAIDAGDNCVVTAGGCLATPLTKDQRGAGFPRESGAHVDVGAFEVMAPTAAGVTVSGRVLAPGGDGLRDAVVVMADPRGITRRVMTNAFGYYTFNDVRAGGSFIMGVESRGLRYTSRIVQVNDTLTGIDFAPLE